MPPWKYFCHLNGRGYLLSPVTCLLLLAHRRSSRSWKPPDADSRCVHFVCTAKCRRWAFIGKRWIFERTASSGSRGQDLCLPISELQGSVSCIPGMNETKCLRWESKRARRGQGGNLQNLFHLLSLNHVKNKTPKHSTFWFVSNTMCKLIECKTHCSALYPLKCVRQSLPPPRQFCFIPVFVITQSVHNMSLQTLFAKESIKNRFFIPWCICFHVPFSASPHLDRASIWRA